MFGLRLKEERAKLGLTQPQLAEAVGSAKRTVIDWEQEKSSPTAKQLMIMNSLGIDTNYLLTGHHLPEPLVAEEQLILEKYREANANTRNKVLLTLMGNEPERKTAKVKGDHNIFDVGSVTVHKQSQAGFTDVQFALIGAVCAILAIIFGGVGQFAIHINPTFSLIMGVLDICFLALTSILFILSNTTGNVVPSKKLKNKKR